MNIQDARASSDFSSVSSADTSVAFAKVVQDAISTAVGIKVKTATFSVSGKQGADVMAVMQDLNRKGYKITRSGTDVTINW